MASSAIGIHSQALKDNKGLHELSILFGEPVGLPRLSPQMRFLMSETGTSVSQWFLWGILEWNSWTEQVHVQHHEKFPSQL